MATPWGGASSAGVSWSTTGTESLGTAAHECERANVGKRATAAAATIRPFC